MAIIRSHEKACRHSSRACPRAQNIGELFQAAVSGMRRVGEAIGEDPEPAIWAMTTRYRALLAAAEEAARLDLMPAESQELQKTVSFWI